MVTSIHVFGTTFVVGLNFFAILSDVAIVTIATSFVGLILSPYPVIYSKSCGVFDANSEPRLIGAQKVIIASLYSFGEIRWITHPSTGSLFSRPFCDTTRWGDSPISEEIATQKHNKSGNVYTLADTVQKLFMTANSSIFTGREGGLGRFVLFSKSCTRKLYSVCRYPLRSMHSHG